MYRDKEKSKKTRKDYIMTYAEKIELSGIEVKNCRTQKEFLHEMQDYTNYHGKEYCSETKYMNTDSDSYYDSIAGGSVSDDVCIYIWYTDGTEYSYYPAFGIQGKFKKTGIKSAIIQDGYGFLTYNYDLCEEWENIRETLTEEEENAIENGIPIENYRIWKALQAEEQKQAEEQEQIPNEIPFAPSGFLEKPEYKINVLDALKEAGYNSGYIRKNKIFPESTVQKFRTGNTEISISTIFRICQILNKDISEVIAFKEV